MSISKLTRVSRDQSMDSVRQELEQKAREAQQNAPSTTATKGFLGRGRAKTAGGRAAPPVAPLLLSSVVPSIPYSNTAAWPATPLLSPGDQGRAKHTVSGGGHGYEHNRLPATPTSDHGLVSKAKSSPILEKFALLTNRGRRSKAATPSPTSSVYSQPELSRPSSLEPDLLPRDSVDEAPYSIGEYQPLLELHRFDMSLDDFGKDWELHTSHRSAMKGNDETAEPRSWFPSASEHTARNKAIGPVVRQPSLTVLADDDSDGCRQQRPSTSAGPQSAHERHQRRRMPQQDQLACPSVNLTPRFAEVKQWSSWSRAGNVAGAVATNPRYPVMAPRNKTAPKQAHRMPPVPPVPPLPMKSLRRNPLYAFPLPPTSAAGACLRSVAPVLDERGRHARPRDLTMYHERTGSVSVGGVP